MDIDVKGHMMFDSSINYGRKDWWMGLIALVIINMVGTMAVEAIDVAMLGTVLLVAVLWANIGLAVGRLRNRGHSSIGAFAIRIIILPWAFIECAFMGSAE